MRIITLALGWMISAAAFADCGTYACTNVKIEKLYVTATTNILVMTSGNEANLNCTGTSGKYVRLNLDNKNGALIYSTLLAARTADNFVKIVIVDGSDKCDISRVEY